MEGSMTPCVRPYGYRVRLTPESSFVSCRHSIQLQKPGLTVCLKVYKNVNGVRVHAVHITGSRLQRLVAAHNICISPRALITVQWFRPFGRIDVTTQITPVLLSIGTSDLSNDTRGSFGVYLVSLLMTMIFPPDFTPRQEGPVLTVRFRKRIPGPGEIHI